MALGADQTNSLDASQINDVISAVITKQLMSNETAVSTSTYTKQVIIGSSDCANVKVADNSTVIKVDTSVFQSADTYQSTVTEITNMVTAAQEQKNTGFFGADQLDEIKEAVKNVVVNTVTQDTMDINSNDLSNVDSSVQMCVDSSNGVNFYSTTTKEVGIFYTEAYQSNVAVQKASTDIANMFDDDQSQKNTGILTVLLLIVGVICIVVVIALAAVAGIVFLGLVKL